MVLPALPDKELLPGQRLVILVEAVLAQVHPDNIQKYKINVQGSRVPVKKEWFWKILSRNVVFVETDVFAAPSPRSADKGRQNVVPPFPYPSLFSPSVRKNPALLAGGGGGGGWEASAKTTVNADYLS